MLLPRWAPPNSNAAAIPLGGLGFDCVAEHHHTEEKKDFVDHDSYIFTAGGGTSTMDGSEIFRPLKWVHGGRESKCNSLVEDAEEG